MPSVSLNISQDDWIKIFWIAFLSYQMIRTLIFQIRSFKFFKKAKANPSTTQFIFNSSYPLIALGIIVFALPIWLFFQFTPWALLIAVPIAITALFFFHIHVELYEFKEDHILSYKKKNKFIKANEITEIAIVGNEINFHTHDFLNHHTFRSGRLSGKKWSEFIEAIEAFAQRNNLSVEKPESQA